MLQFPLVRDVQPPSAEHLLRAPRAPLHAAATAGSLPVLAVLRSVLRLCAPKHPSGASGE